MRLAIVEQLAVSDRAPSMLSAQFGLTGNLLAHHLDVLERAGLIERTVSAGDRRRRYVRLRHQVLGDLAGHRPPADGAGPVRVHPQLGPVAAGRRAVAATHRRRRHQRRHSSSRQIHPGESRPPAGPGSS